MIEIDEKLKAQIDGMSYTQLLRLWRNAPMGHPMFQGEIANYFAEVMKKKQEEIGADAAVAASKEIGWSEH